MKDDFITANFKLATGQIQPLKIPLSEVDKYFTGPEGKEKLNEEAVLARLKERYPKIYQSHIDAEYSGYSQKYLSDDSGSIPAQLYRKYALAKDKQNFDFSTPTGKLSTVGQRAIRRKYEEAQRGGIRKEQAALTRADTLQKKAANAVSLAEAEAYENTGAMETIAGYLAPMLNRRMTAAVTGQEASKALPLGLYPEGRLTPATGFSGTAKRAAGDLLTSQGMAGAAGAVAAAPAAFTLASAYPVLGLVGGAASLAPSAVDVMQGDYGGAAANAILNIPGMAVSRPVKTAKGLGHMSRMAKMDLDNALYRAENELEIRKLRDAFNMMDRASLSNRLPEPEMVKPNNYQRIMELRKRSVELQKRADALAAGGRYDAAENLRRQAREIEVTLSRLNL